MPPAPSRGTAGIHVERILTKLDFRSRAQTAAWVTERERVGSGNIAVGLPG